MPDTEPNSIELSNLQFTPDSSPLDIAKVLASEFNTTPEHILRVLMRNECVELDESLIPVRILNSIVEDITLDSTLRTLADNVSKFKYPPVTRATAHMARSFENSTTLRDYAQYVSEQGYSLKAGDQAKAVMQIIIKAVEAKELNNSEI